MTEKNYSKHELEAFKIKALHWAKQFDVFCILDNNYCINALDVGNIEFMLCAAAEKELIGNGENDFLKLEEFLNNNNYKTPIPGFLTYDLKNQIEKLSSRHFDGIGFPLLYFFKPIHTVIFYKDGRLEVISRNENLYDEINSTNTSELSANTNVSLIQRLNKDKYLQNIESLKQHIIDGDIYEINYCIEFYDKNADIDPYSVYKKLNQKSPSPFASFFKVYDKFLMCSSPERFLKKEADLLISQPIKGTIKRGLNAKQDELLKNELLNSEKERAENLMIVDLVRNDLAKSSKTGTIEVAELFGIYSFKQVHQMISTVKSEKRKDISNVETIKNAFPMGSMTGAPKVKVMELTEKYENCKRGLYSGALGYFDASRDFDFNVVIRSIQYNSTTKYLNFQVGSAITYDSISEHEYEECLLKAKAMFEVLK